MSEAASPHVALAKSTRNSANPSSTVDGSLLPSLAPLLHEWLPRQRWFAGKGRPVTGFGLVSATEMLPLDGTAGPGLLHLLVRVQQPSPSAPAADDCYQLLLGVRTSLPTTLAGALIGRVERGPLAGRTVYDALHDPRL
nr:maltokinase [Streptomyces sp. DSM 41633]